MPIDDGSVTIDGRYLGDMGWYLAAPPTIGTASFRTSFISVTGTHGSKDSTLTDAGGLAFADRREVSLTLRTVGTYVDAVRSKLELGKYVGREVEVRWRILPGSFRGRLSASEPSETWLRGVFSHYELTLTLDAQPLLFGDLETVSGTNFEVLGTVRSYPTLECTASAATLKVTAPDKTFIEQTGLKGGAKIRIVCSDGAERGVYVNSVRVLPTIDSDFFSLEPGKVNLAVSGGTIDKVTYEPLWLMP